MTVIDASVLAAFILKEAGWEELAKFLVKSITPSLAIEEVANAVWKQVTLKNAMSVTEARQALKILKSMLGVNITIYTSHDMIEDAFDIAVRRKITIYDAIYIALAIKTGSTLITLDRKQAEAAAAEGINVTLL